MQKSYRVIRQAAARRILDVGVLPLCAVLSIALPSPAAAFEPPAAITVVTDFDYPPFLFTSDEGELRGIIKDKWDLWSKKTGVPVRVKGVTWLEAQQSVQRGTDDVIETLSHTEDRAALYEYSPAYAPVEANVFFHPDISGIGDVASMRRFTIGFKEGSACGNWLAERGVSLRGYSRSDLLVQAAGKGEVRLFCMDSLTARYYLYKLGLADEFRTSPPLYTTQFHWAVKKGRTELRDFIQAGFNRLGPEEMEAIDNRWIGNPIQYPIATRFFYYLAIIAEIALVLYLVLVVWNRTLRTRIAAKTSALSAALQEQQRNHALLAGQKQVLELVANGSPLEQSMDALLRIIEAQSPGMLCSILLLDGDGVHVRHLAAPSLPPEFCRAIDGEPIGEEAGSCGTAMFRREAVISEDIATDPLWTRYRELALGHGLRAAWSTPIFDARKDVLGSFALYFREPCQPNDRHRQLIAMATDSAAIAISQRREQQAL